LNVTDALLQIAIKYDPVRLTGRLERRGESTSSAWDRIRSRAINDQADAVLTDTTIDISWPKMLGILRDFGGRAQQQALEFRFVPEGEAGDRIRQFSEDVRKARAARNSLTLQVTRDQIEQQLREKGFTRRALKPFQLRDLERLLSLPHGANFSVPGAGKTTVTFALHLLTGRAGQHLLVIAPKTAFPAWREVISDCMEPAAPDKNAEPFVVLEGGPDEIDRLLRSGATRFLMTYDLMVRQTDLLAGYLARQPVHVVLDEAHRMKAGLGSQRGAFLINIAALPARRDILTGTPMPQGPGDLAAQLAFLWPGQGLDLQVARGIAPRDVLGQLYVRTTKRELEIPRAHRHFRQIEMAPGQQALYGIVRSESLRQLTQAIRGRDRGEVDFVRARRSVMRLLQLSTNPILALHGMAENVVGLNSGVIDQVLSEGPSLKMKAVEAHARELAAAGRKSVVWTIFTDTLHELERMLADLNPVTLYGGVPSGDDADLTTREGRLKRFHRDPACKVLIANPAAAGEGISLHTVCHDALYVDRSYVSTHYLQSIDRIHRLGLPPDIETNIYIYQTKAPIGLGSIDYSVSRRLATKIRGLQQLLDDPDLHELALDEENADDPIDYDVELQDLVDLVAELEGRDGFSGEEDDA
jgi:SNF2 family DNA or RNA helicase